jgi:hypothetical protein
MHDPTATTASITALSSKLLDNNPDSDQLFHLLLLLDFLNVGETKLSASHQQAYESYVLQNDSIFLMPAALKGQKLI